MGYWEVVETGDGAWVKGVRTKDYLQIRKVSQQKCDSSVLVGVSFPTKVFQSLLQARVS